MKLSYEERCARLDGQVLKLLTKHGLQEVMSSLKRLCAQQVQLYENESSAGQHALPKHNWGLAHTIVSRADNSLYGQHCGDVFPKT